MVKVGDRVKMDFDSTEEASGSLYNVEEDWTWVVGTFLGTVVEKNPKTGYVLVEYTDGDNEHIPINVAESLHYPV